VLECYTTPRAKSDATKQYVVVPHRIYHWLHVLKTEKNSSKMDFSSRCTSSISVYEVNKKSNRILYGSSKSAIIA